MSEPEIQLDGPEAPALTAEVWYERAPDLTDPALLDRLRRRFPGLQPQDGSVTVPHGSGVPAEQVPPLLTVLMAATPLGESGKAGPDASQTWDWAEAEAVAARARESVLVTELMASWSSRQERLDALTAVVAELVSATDPLAVSWVHSQRLNDPSTVGPGDLDGVVNVRMFSVGREPDVLVMDTLGLHVFGLPDVQCHFRDRSPGEVAELLFGTAVYVFGAGDVIEDGNTISGTDGEGRFVCRRETSLLPPTRPVVDVDLGAPWAAGNRDA